MTATTHAYLYFLHPIRPTFTQDITEDEAMIMQAHFGYLKDLLSAGVLVLGGPCTDGAAIAVAVIEAKSEAAARAIVENDPAVKQGLAKAELHPFRLSLLRSG